MLRWYERWAEQERAQKVVEFTSDDARDRLFQVLTSFEKSYTWQPQSEKLRPLWDHFRRFSGLDFEEQKQRKGAWAQQASLEIHSEEDALAVFQRNPEKTVQIFLSFYMIERGLIWATRNLDNAPRLMGFFVRYVLQSNAVRDAGHIECWRHTLNVIEQAQTELPMMETLSKALPDAFSQACVAQWGRKALVSFKIRSTDNPENAVVPASSGTATNVRGWGASSESNIWGQAGDGWASTPGSNWGTVCNADDPAHTAGWDEGGPIDAWVSSQDASSAQVISRGGSINVGERNVQDEALSTTSATGSQSAGQKPVEKEGSEHSRVGQSPEPFSAATGWPDAQGETGGDPNDHGTRNTPNLNDLASLAIGERRPPTLLSMLGPVALPLTHRTGIVETSMRRIKEIIAPIPDESFSLAAGDMSTTECHDRGARPDAVAVEGRIRNMLAQVVMEPWPDWDTKTPESAKPEIRKMSKGKITKGWDASGGTSSSGYNPLKDCIMLVVTDATVPHLSIGMGIRGTWVQLARRRHYTSRPSDGKESKKTDRGDLWYIEEMLAVIPSFYIDH